MDTIWLAISIIGFISLLAAFFFGGFVLLDFIWGRKNGDI